MVLAVVALIATLAALTATGLLVTRAMSETQTYLYAWSAALFGLSLALAAITVGGITGFSGPLFRTIQLGSALVAPLWLAVGVVEVVARYVQVRFAVLLVFGSYSIVATVILLLDPLTGAFGTDLPEADAHYTWLPQTVIAGAHTLAVVAMVACAGATAVRANGQDQDALANFLPVALGALAVVLMVSATRGYLPGAAAPLALGAAAGLVWFGAGRPFPVGEPYDDEDDYEYEDDIYEEESPRRRPPPPERRRPTGPQPVAQVPTDPFLASPGMYGQITIYSLEEDYEEEFDRLVAAAIRMARQAEPDTFVYTSHALTNSPAQRIVYQLFRDRAAYEDHRQLPHTRQFEAESEQYVVATNIIQLKLGSAKVVPLPALTHADLRGPMQRPMPGPAQRPMPDPQQRPIRGGGSDPGPDGWRGRSMAGGDNPRWSHGDW